jgi:hypothetical protein
VRALPVDFKARRSLHQTLRDRKNLHGSAASVVDYERKTLRTECVGCAALGFVWGAGLVGFFWLLSFWVNVGGAQ